MNSKCELCIVGADRHNTSLCWRWQALWLQLLFVGAVERVGWQVDGSRKSSEESALSCQYMPVHECENTKQISDKFGATVMTRLQPWATGTSKQVIEPLSDEHAASRVNQPLSLRGEY